ncbi:immune inhibitor A [bacterium]|nr:immune inhibitor A [bacterium]
MRRNMLLLMGIVILFSAITMIAIYPAGAATYQKPANDIMDIGPKMRTMKPVKDRIAGPMANDMMSGMNFTKNTLSISQTTEPVYKLWFGLDDYCGYFYFKWYELRAVGTNCEIWVALDMGWTTPPVICQEQSTDPFARELPVITDEQVAYLLNEFDNNIYPTDTEYFGAPDPHDGTNSLLVAWGHVPPDYYDGDKIVLLVDNVRDRKWYDNDYPWYIAGFFSLAYEAYFDRNIITIDAYDWANRMGPDAEQPFVYEGITAHEFQHLLHCDRDVNEVVWVHEGCADLASYLCGYGIMNNRHVAQFAEHPENSLVVWGDQGDLELLSDYGNVYLFLLNLYEQFGGPFIKALVLNQEVGISGVDSTLSASGCEETFADVYHKFAVSLVTDPGHKGGGAFAFKGLDFDISLDTPEAYATPGAPPWGTDFIKIENPKNIAGLSFDGIDFYSHGTNWSAISLPFSDGKFLWSGMGDLLDNWLIIPLDLTGLSPMSTATLTLNHYFGMEEYWDFGFVQVSTDGGHTWTSLCDNEGLMTYVTDPGAHPTVKANVPGFTGSSGWFIDSTFDLTPYRGQNIYLAFRYVTDWLYSYDGWIIDDILVTGGETAIFHSDGSSTEGFKDITEILPINCDFTVTLIGASEKKDGTKFKVLPLNLDRATEEGSIGNMAKAFSDSDYMVMLVTFDAPENFTEYAGYSYEIVYKMP